MRADLFFSPYYKAPLAAPCPTVVTIHDLIPLTFPVYSSGARRPASLAFRLWAGLLARRARAVVTDSEFSRGEIVRLLGLAPQRVRVIPLGVGPGFRPGLPRQTLAAVRLRYGIPGEYLLAVGNFLPHKNLPRLVEAFAALPSALRERAHLVLAGTPGGHGAARPTPPESLRGPEVLLPGFIAPADLPALYAGATGLLCPSLAEGFGLPVLEAMACGTPVLCARAGSLPEVAGEAALYVDPRETGSIAAGLQRLLEDKPLRHRLAARGLERARDFDARHTTARLLDLLEELAGERGASRRDTEAQ